MTKKQKDSNNSGVSHPAFVRRLNHVRVSVWMNTGDNGNWFNTVITRRYRDGEEWKDSSAFNGLGDLALLAEGIRLAQNFIADNESTVNSLDE